MYSWKSKTTFCTWKCQIILHPSFVWVDCLCSYIEFKSRKLSNTILNPKIFRSSKSRFTPHSNFLLTVPRRHFCCGSYPFVIIFIVLRVAWLCGHSKTVRIALCIVFCFVQASTVTTSLQQLLTLPSVWLNDLFCVSHFCYYYSLFLSYNRSWGRGWVPAKPV